MFSYSMQSLYGWLCLVLTTTFIDYAYKLQHFDNTQVSVKLNINDSSIK